MLESERLRFELAHLEDKGFFFKLLNSPNWIKYIGDRGIKTEQDSENYIKNSLIKTYNDKGFGLYKMVVKTTNLPIGICGFVKRDYLDSVDIGFAILPEFEGQGYTFEAAKAILEYGQTELGLGTVYGITTPDNKASQHLLVKLGLQFVFKRTDKIQNQELLIFSNQQRISAPHQN
ncbi:RimJ/RimL family protein N-acetyltransferase [Adhaeribacter arboris]|uniref:RimJ/RimL family protein N-acetyltransferase n=1 Tax=Adhaeribacter arboris TaxID=2072846 RepID=A0A2T2YJ61_9BACT|nr:GNAT family N-acetyltransferase [Adhaeribacter arboris]PSR55541.1 RimJ/RimL family protein N-acetyltransferase [Adhaeribacter arboris]